MRTPDRTARNAQVRSLLALIAVLMFPVCSHAQLGLPALTPMPNVSAIAGSLSNLPSAIGIESPSLPTAHIPSGTNTSANNASPLNIATSLLNTGNESVDAAANVIAGANPLTVAPAPEPDTTSIQALPRLPTLSAIGASILMLSSDAVPSRDSLVPKPRS